MSVPDRDRQTTAAAEALAEQYYAHLLRAGAETLACDPLVELCAPANGKVLWRQGKALAGYAVSELAWDEAVQKDPDYGRLGFDERLLQDGIWVLKGLRFEQKGGRWFSRPGSEVQIFAHFDQADDAWHVVTFEPDAGRDGVWERQQGPAFLSAEQKAVIARIARETEILLDAAVRLQDDYPAYHALTSILMTRARADPQHALRIGAIVRPSRHPTPAGSQFLASAFGNLPTLGVPLYRAVAAKANRDSTDLMAAAASMRLCPPYEHVSYGLSRDALPARARHWPLAVHRRRGRSSSTQQGRSRRSAAGQSPGL